MQLFLKGQFSGPSSSSSIIFINDIVVDFNCVINYMQMIQKYMLLLRMQLLQVIH